MWILIEKKRRRLSLLDGGAPVYVCKVALGRKSMSAKGTEGTKDTEGDGGTPEATYTIPNSETPMFTCPVALGRQPIGAKREEGDGRTPEGIYKLCLIKEQGKYGRSLALSYPSPQDASLALREGRIDQATYDAILTAHQEGCRPPWGTPLGGEIYLHEGGTASDWTQGCIAVDSTSMDSIFPLWEQIEAVRIEP